MSNPRSGIIAPLLNFCWKSKTYSRCPQVSGIGLDSKTGLDKRYISRHLPPAVLAPNIIEAILDGSHAEPISLVSWQPKVLRRRLA
jgi:hypothetical protein